MYENKPFTFVGIVLAACLLTLVFVYAVRYSYPPLPNTTALENLNQEFMTNLNDIQRRSDELMASFYICGYMDRARDSTTDLLTRLNQYPELKKIVLDTNFRMLTQEQKDILRNLK